MYEHNATCSRKVSWSYQVESREVSSCTRTYKSLHVSEHLYTARAFSLLVEKDTDWVTRGRKKRKKKNMERNAPPTLEITLPDGSVAEVDGTTEFTSRVDKMEDRVNDGNRYKGLLSKEDYDKRKRKLHDKLRQEADPEKYKLEKLEVRAPSSTLSLTLSLARSHALAAPRAAPHVHHGALARFSSSTSHPLPTQTPSRQTQSPGQPLPPLQPFSS